MKDNEGDYTEYGWAAFVSSGHLRKLLVMNLVPNMQKSLWQVMLHNSVTDASQSQDFLASCV